MSAENDIVDRLEARAYSIELAGYNQSAADMREAAAEIVRLRGEVAPKYDRELIARMLDDVAAKLPLLRANSYTRQAALLRAADAAGAHTATIAPAEAKGGECSRQCMDTMSCDNSCKPAGGDNGLVDSLIQLRDAKWSLSHESMPDDVQGVLNMAIETLRKKPAGGEAVAWNVLRIGNYGAAYDSPDTHRAFTYDHQPGNVMASRLGSATIAAASADAGDSIDRGLSLLKALREIGLGVFQIGPEDTTPPTAQVQPVCPPELIEWMQARDILPDEPFTDRDLIAALDNHEAELLAAHPAAGDKVRELVEDEDGMPAGFNRWYVRAFLNRGADTGHYSDCELAWRAALAQPQEADRG